MGDIELGEDVREQIELLRRQSRRSRLFVDKGDEALRIWVFAFLDEFEHGQSPDSSELRS